MKGNIAARIVIVGRPNVGKSTLFNRLIGRRRSLVHDEPGVTRDRIEEKTEWWFHAKPYPVLMVDTGGLGGDRFAEEIQHQVDTALSSADAVIAVFDAQTGLTAADRELLRNLSKSGVIQRMPVVAAVNKVDAEVHESLVADFYSLGIEKILTLSAEHGRGIDDLKEALILALDLPSRWEGAQQAPSEKEEEIETSSEHTESAEEDDLEEADLHLEIEDEDEDEKFEAKIPRIAVIGQPNVGKSTFINRVLGEKRMITSPIAGTTVDSVDSLVSLNDKPFIFVDTAGIRRKSKTEQGVEVLSVVQTKKALERADLALLILDGERGLTDQDEKIGGLIEEAGASVILCMNKWDVQKKNVKFTREMAAERIRGKMAYLKYAPILFVSAKEGKGFDDLGDLVTEILHQRKLKIPTHEFTEWVRKESTVHNPMNAKFYLCHQAGRNPPTFVCHVSNPDKVHFSLRRHLVNALRERWGFMGSPVRMLFVEGKSTRKKPESKRPKHKSTRRS